MMPPTETSPPAASTHTLEARNLDFAYGRQGLSPCTL